VVGLILQQNRNVGVGHRKFQLLYDEIIAEQPALLNE
jgi:hypothetical protein